MTDQSPALSGVAADAGLIDPMIPYRHGQELEPHQLVHGLSVAFVFGTNLEGRPMPGRVDVTDGVVRIRMGLYAICPVLPGDRFWFRTPEVG